jgi:hypothetical protein
MLIGGSVRQLGQSRHPDRVQMDASSMAYGAGRATPIKMLDDLKSSFDKVISARS